MEAIAEVEKKYERGVHIAEFAYAHAFFRILNGSKRVTVKDIGWFSPGLTAQDLREKKQDWLAAIDRLIESRGACCWLPLSVSDGWRLFPETKFQTSERRRRQSELSAENTPASAGKRRASAKPRIRRWRDRRKLSWLFIRRTLSAAGALAGRVLNYASTTRRICSGAGASVSRHLSQWSAG
nr:plasmid SOS inhibition protein A [Escherichia coli]